MEQITQDEKKRIEEAFKQNHKGGVTDGDRTRFFTYYNAELVAKISEIKARYK